MNAEKQGKRKSMEKQTKRELFWEIFRFLLVGGTATLVDYFLFWLLDGVLFPLISTAKAWQTASLVIATAVGFCMGLLVNWLLSVKFVFLQTKERVEVTSKRSFALFAIIGVVGLAITEGGILLLVNLIPPFSLFGVTGLLGTSWVKWLSRIIMTCIVLVWNYIGRKLFIFK